MAHFIIYGSKSKIPHLLICDGDPSSIPLRDGQSILVLGNDEPPNIDPKWMRKKVATHHGIDPNAIGSGRCVMVHPETGMVTAAIMADHEHYPVHEDHRVVPTDTAQAGWKHDGERFLCRYAVADASADRAGLVHSIVWHPEGQKPPSISGTAHVAHNTAAVGDQLPGFYAVKTSGTVKL